MPPARSTRRGYYKSARSRCHPVKEQLVFPGVQDRDGITEPVTGMIFGQMPAHPVSFHRNHVVLSPVVTQHNRCCFSRPWQIQAKRVSSERAQARGPGLFILVRPAASKNYGVFFRTLENSMVPDCKSRLSRPFLRIYPLVLLRSRINWSSKDPSGHAAMVE
jgi:hypothetical protein